MEGERERSCRSWEMFCVRRSEYLTVLAGAVEKGFLRKDTAHPVFCGCIDWHSSVHGAYALLAAARLTGQARWADLVDRALDPGKLRLEMQSLCEGHLDHELPYGYSWFLALAREREGRWGKTDLLPFAIEVVSRLRVWLFALTDEQVVYHIQRPEYQNLSWAVLNLWEWATWKKNDELQAELEVFTRDKLVPLDDEKFCSFQEAADEFFSPVLQRARVILRILPRVEGNRWLALNPLAGQEISPLTLCRTPHAGGLNFSRAWGLWELYGATGDVTFRDRYVAHIVTHIAMPKFWEEDYRQHGHWVPQFGIYAIALSLDG